jgi:hypothetical protein
MRGRSLSNLLLNRAFGFPQDHALLLLRRKRLFGPHAEEIAFQFPKEREERDDNFGLHVVLGKSQSLFDTDDADRTLH